MDTQKNLYQVQQSRVKYRFSFHQNIKMDCHVIFFLQHTVSAKFPRKSEKTFSLLKNTQEIRWASILSCEQMNTIIYFRKNMMIQPSFYY